MQKRQRITPLKSNATKNFTAGRLTAAQRGLIHRRVAKGENEIRAYKKCYGAKLKTIKGSGARGRGQRGARSGAGAYFFNDAKEVDSDYC